MAKKKKLLKRQFTRIEIETIFRANNIMSFKSVDGFEVCRTKNINLFLMKGFKCDVCGVEVDHFKIRRDIHADKNKGTKEVCSLVPINTNGTEMTRDHITPQCLNGGNELDNLVPMCQPCNGIWKSKFDVMEKINASIINLTMADFIGDN